MRSAVVCARASLRSSRRGWGAVLVLVVVGMAATLAAGGAARRTDTAFARGLRAGRAADLTVSADASADRPAGRALLDRALRLPGIEASAVAGAIEVGIVRHGELDARLDVGSALGLAPEDDRYGRDISRYHVLDGRLPDPARVDEVVITRHVAEVTGWAPGDRVTDVKLFAAADHGADGLPIPSLGTALHLRVVGIVQVPEELVTPAAEQNPRILFTPAFARAHPDAPFYYLSSVRLTDGARGVEAYRVAASELTSPSSVLFSASNSEGIRAAESSNRPLVVSLWVLAALSFLVTVLLAAQAMARQFVTAGADQGLLRALGVTARQRLLAMVLTAVVVGIAGTAIAVPLAWSVSGMAPFGVARAAEPHPGLHADGMVLALGALSVVAATSLAALLPAWRLARRPRQVGEPSVTGAERPSALVEALARSGVPLTAVLGARLALQPGRGHSAVPVRSILASLVLATVAATGVMAFQADLDRLTSTPPLYGWNADAEAGSAFAVIPSEAVDQVHGIPHLASLSGVTLGDLTINGVDVPAVGIDQLIGSLNVTIDEGRAARHRGEIVLGTKTMRALNVRLGDAVDLRVAGAASRATVVGVGTFPSMGQTQFHSTSLGVGAAGVSSLFPSRPDAGGVYNWLLFKFTSSDARADVTALRATVAEAGCPQDYCVVTDPRPSELASYASARSIPAAVALVLSVLVAATVWHAVSLATRRRHVDLAILAAIGLRPRERAAVLRWQGAIMVMVALLIGLPIGLVIGNGAWSVFNDRLGIDVAPVLPVLVLGIGAAGALGLALVVASITPRLPGRAARWS